MEIIKIEGINKIEFIKKVFSISFIDKNTKNIETYIIEYRRDPLTKFWIRINIDSVKRQKDEIIFTKNKRECLFCKENVFQYTTSFINNKVFLDENSILIPNKYPFSKYHAILIPNFNEHIVSFSELKFLDFYNSFKLALEFFKENYERNKEAKYISINLNLGYFAGTSIEHLHFQLIQDEKPTNYFDIVIKESQNYFNQYRRFLIEDIALSEEKIGERFIKKGKLIWWFASFAPFKDNEVIGVVDSFNILNMAKINLDTFIKELYEFLVKYEKTFGNNFNLVIYDPVFIKEPGLKPFIRIFTRNQNDTGFMELLHLEPVITSLPEETAKKLKD